MNDTERGIFEQFSYWQQPIQGLETVHLNPAQPIAVVGCGTSYYLAQTLAATLNRLGKSALAVPGGEWLLHPTAYRATQGPIQVLALSRSGETTETVAAARNSRAAGHRVIGITCAKGSSLAAVSDHILELETHPLEGIVMTVSASLMLWAGLRLAGLAMPPGFAERAQHLLEASAPKLSTLPLNQGHLVYLGAAELYGIANEAALKAQEMSLSLVQAYHPMEYRHGPISMVEKGVLATLLYHPAGLREEAALARELEAKGATVLGLGGPGQVSLELDEPNPALRGLLLLPVLQLLGERIAQAKGLDSTAPRHLSKVVTLS